MISSNSYFHSLRTTLDCFKGSPTAGVTCVWAGVDKFWEQEKLEARKMPVNRAESHTSGARLVSRLLSLQDSIGMLFDFPFELKKRLVSCFLELFLPCLHRYL